MIVGIVTFGAWLLIQIVSIGVRFGRSRGELPPPTQSMHSTQSMPAPVQRSPWSILGWMFVGLMGVGFLGGLFLAAPSSSCFPGTVFPAYETESRCTGYHGNKISRVTLDDQEVRLQEKDTDSSGRPTFMAYTGPRTLHIEYETNNPQEERFYQSTVSINGSSTFIDATPTVRAASVLPADSDKSPSRASILELTPSNATASSSIPLADSVEVLTDPAKMPAPAIGIVPGPGGFGTYEQQMTQAVWIDEPGLLIRMKRIGFDNSDGDVPNYEYYSKHAGEPGRLWRAISLANIRITFPAVDTKCWCRIWTTAGRSIDAARSRSGIVRPMFM